MKTVSPVVDDITIEDTPQTIVDEIFDEVERGFGVVPENGNILNEGTPVKKIQPVEITPKKIERKVTRTFVDVIVERIDDFFGFPFKFFGLVEDEHLEEEPSGGGMLESGGGYSSEIPQVFLNMLSYQPEKTYYLAQNEPGASDDNNCEFPTYMGGLDGPCLTYDGMLKLNIEPGNAIALREGTYNNGKQYWGINLYGTEEKPIRIFAYNDEKVILDLTHMIDEKVSLKLGGSYTTFEGFEIHCPNSPQAVYYLECMTIHESSVSDHTVVYNNLFKGAYEDAIKTTTESQNILIYKNEFVGTGGEGESIDVFGADHVWVVENDFHDDNIQMRPPQSIMWVKGGAYDVHIYGNYFHDTVVRNHALHLGGCCWNNWAGTPGVDHVAVEVYAKGNRFENIEVIGTYRYAAALGFEGCKDCYAIDNHFKNVGAGIGVRSTIDAPYILGSLNAHIEGNTMYDVTTDNVIRIHEDSKVGLYSDYNHYCTGEPQILYEHSLISLEDFQLMGYDLNSDRCEGGSNTTVVTPGEEEGFIEIEPIGDKEFEMNVYTDQIVKDIPGLTKGFGNVIHPWMHSKFLDAYIEEVGVDGTTIRMGHKYDNFGRGFPPLRVPKKLSENGAKVMVVIKGIPAEEGIAYCAEYSGSNCVTYESSGPAKDMQGWKDYVKDVVSHYNSKGISYFIIWNEPNYVIENWKEVCRAPNDCWWGTMEEFVDLTVAGVEAVYEVDPNNEVGVDGTSSFFGSLYLQNGTKAYVPIEVFEALEANGLKATHHFHHYNPDPYTMAPGGSPEQALKEWENYDAFLGTNLDEFSDSIPGRSTINGDGIYAVSSAMALIANSANYDIDQMGWFQLYSNVHEPGTIEGRFLEWNENMIDRSGVYKPVFWLAKLLHEAPGTLLVEDDLDESDTVRAFTVRNQEGTGYCWYGVNFDMENKESATIKIHAKNLRTDVGNWLYTTYKFGREDGNPYHDDVEPEIEILLEPMINSIRETPGATWHDYIDHAWPVISEINSWDSVRPTKTEKIVPGNRAELSTQFTLEHEEVRILCLEETTEVSL